MDKPFIITIDTEPDCDVSWKRSDPLTFESVLVGIPKILRPIWDKFEVRPVYFVSPEVVGNAQCCDVLKEEIRLGAEVGSHLHSEYIEPHKKYEDFAGTPSKEYPCFAHDTEIEFEKIKNLTELIERNVGVRPVSYRAARYGADLDTIKSLKRLGYTVDSSVTPRIDWSYQSGPDHSRGPQQPYFVSDESLYHAGNSGILEVPITISEKRFFLLPENWLFRRWLRPTHMTVFEMKLLVSEFLKKYENPVLNMMFHSMELIPGKTPFVKSTFAQKAYVSRLERTIAYLKDKGFRSRTLGQLYAESAR